MADKSPDSLRFGSQADAPRTVIESLRLVEEINTIIMHHLKMVETAESELRLEYAHGIADGYAAALDYAKLLKGHQCASLRNAFQGARNTRLAELRACEI